MQIIAGTALVLSIGLATGCAFWGGSSTAGSRSSPYVINDNIEPVSCPSGMHDRQFAFNYLRAATSEWAVKLYQSERAMNAVIQNGRFRAQCIDTPMAQTIKKTIEQVCIDLTCANDPVKPTVIDIDFFNDPSSRAIGSHYKNVVRLNEARIGSGAGSAGNIMHEFAHDKGYTHAALLPFLSNYARFVSGTVPYVIGDLMSTYAEQHKD